MAADVDKFYRTLAREIADAIVYADAEGLIAFWNKGAERIFGFSEVEAVGKSLDIIIPESQRSRHWAGYVETIKTGTTRYGQGDVLSVPAMRKDGTRISIAFTILLCRLIISVVVAKRRWAILCKRGKSIYL